MLLSINPSNAKIVAKHKPYTKLYTQSIVQQVDTAWSKWRLTSHQERSELLLSMAKKLVDSKNKLAELMGTEMGKPIKQGIAEIEKCAAVCEYYYQNAAGFLQEQDIKTDGSKSYVSFQPIGVVLAVMPWNFPFWQVFRFLAPALAAGNCGLLKHASNVMGCALAIEDIVKQAGFPDNVFRALLLDSASVNDVIANPLVKALTLTGSTNAGKKVAEKAGSLLKKTVLELGGSDAYIVLEDADLEHAAETCVNSRLINAGQSCIAAKRFVVVERIEKEFTRLFVEKMKAKVMGDPMVEGTDVGPMARADLRDELHEQVDHSVTKGAKCLLGGYVPEGKNAFYPPTVLTNVKKGMPAYDEELFGPVAAIISAKDEADAIRIANDSVFGLGGAVFTQDKERGELIAATQMEAGSCFVNGLVKSDPRLPFGGIKESGYGRELGMFGIHEFVNIKSVWIA
ncbi:NAD-dependent succinate-semialdehyde dehydrogenase [Mucilaginibacter auburnensis]|uniref:Succinate-semialdehyde dehydrogenase/glutarate-semialdehyde dehydrogenase n=1 Tax=Mucilaginibacter auburnensis TaxID=1457233 RepID=A0A2H9VL64_9SPHI|nr:NAD-dependent succinate-semialdehyde dehydrogenase [Mucilaginibacter auburnensis]PJJ79025.1 succinate-semialdehyde dehydrogenase/glutarate-semialdehyde dehydrogenase [Mucilaginibacter auburnensis]